MQTIHSQETPELQMRNLETKLASLDPHLNNHSEAYKQAIKDVLFNIEESLSKDPQQKPISRHMVLNAAIRYNCLSLFELLLKQDSEKLEDILDGLLTQAISYGRVDMMNILLRDHFKSEWDVQSEYAQGLLLFAASEGQEGAVKFLIDQGVKLDKKFQAVEPLFNAVSRRESESVKCLLSVGIRFDDQTSGYSLHETCLTKAMSRLFEAEKERETCKNDVKQAPEDLQIAKSNLEAAQSKFDRAEFDFEVNKRSPFVERYKAKLERCTAELKKCKRVQKDAEVALQNVEFNLNNANNQLAASEKIVELLLAAYGVNLTEKEKESVRPSEGEYIKIDSQQVRNADEIERILRYRSLFIDENFLKYQSLTWMQCMRAGIKLGLQSVDYRAADLWYHSAIKEVFTPLAVLGGFMLGFVHACCIPFRVLAQKKELSCEQSKVDNPKSAQDLQSQTSSACPASRPGQTEVLSDNSSDISKSP